MFTLDNQTPLVLAKSLVEGKIQKSWLIVGSYLENGSSLLDTYLLITNAMYQIGQWWQENKISVADEHLATATCDYVLARLQFTLNKDKFPSKRALLFCVEGEEHYIALKMLASLLEEYRWEVKNLGANLPLPYAINSIEKWKPEVVGISISQVHLLPSLKQYINEIESLAYPPTVLVGGRLLQHYDLTGYGSTQTVFINKVEQFEQWLLENALKQSLVSGEKI